MARARREIIVFDAADRSPRTSARRRLWRPRRQPTADLGVTAAAMGIVIDGDGRRVLAARFHVI